MSGALTANKLNQNSVIRNDVNNCGLSLMKALEHLYIIRKYKELDSSANHNNFNTKMCIKSSTRSDNDQWPNAVTSERNVETVSLSSNCFSDKDSPKVNVTESTENLVAKYFMLNSNKESPFKSVMEQVNKNSGNLKNVGNSFSEKENQIDNQINKKNCAQVLNKNRKSRGFKSERKNDSTMHSDRKSNASDTRCKKKNQEAAENYQTNSTTRQEGKEISNCSTHTSDTLEKISKREVIFKFRESANQYWVMDANNLVDYDEIETFLNGECCKCKNVDKPEKYCIYGCLYENKWYRGKVVSLHPNFVHFVDFGKTCMYESEFKKIPEQIQKVPGLVYRVVFKQDIPENYLTQNLEARKLLVKCTQRRDSSIPVIEPIKESELTIMKPEEKGTGEVLKNKTPEKSATTPSKPEFLGKYVLDTITKSSKGIILLTPGRGKIRFGSIFPDNDVEAKSLSEKMINFNSSNLTPIVANKGECVLVSDIEKNNHRGKVLCSLGNTYYVLLIDSGVIMAADEVYSLSEEMKMYKGLGVVITFQEIFSEELLSEIDVCYYSVVEEKENGKWKCKLKSNDKDNLLANVIIERPTQKGSTRFLKSGCSVEISAAGTGNTFYVREIDETSAWKLMELNKIINKFCETEQPKQLWTYAAYIEKMVWRNQQHKSGLQSSKGWMAPGDTPKPRIKQDVHPKKAPDFTGVPKVGYLCSAKFEEDQTFYRGLVKSIQDDKVEVLFVDFGNSQFFDMSSSGNVKNLKKLLPGFQAVPFFAIEIFLADVSVKSYSPKVKKYLQKLILESTELILTYRDFYKKGVYLKEKLTGNILNDILNDTHFEIVESSAVSNNDKFFGERMAYTIFSVGTKCDMVVLHISDKEFDENYTFWCSDASSENFKHIHSELNSKIAAYCSGCSDPYRPSKQELCLAQFEGVWYRALTLDVDDDNFIVFFPDFGNMYEVTSKCIRKIKEEFIMPPALAVNCTINDPERLNGKPELSKKVFEILETSMNKCTLSVEICKYENETFYLTIPEIEAIFASL